jgi:hypothetical protein
MNGELDKVITSLPTDYSDYGGDVIRWEDPEDSYPDCSCGCKWFLKAEELGICTKPDSYREGMLTHEHQAGYFCFEH